MDGALPPRRSPSPGTSLSLLLLHSSKKSKISPGSVRGEGREWCAGRPVGQEGSEGHRTPSRGLGLALEEHPKTRPRVPAVLWQWGWAALSWPHCREHPAGMEMPRKSSSRPWLCARPTRTGFRAHPGAVQVPRPGTGRHGSVTPSSSRVLSGRWVPHGGLGRGPQGLWGLVRGLKRGRGPPPMAMLPGLTALC